MAQKTAGRGRATDRALMEIPREALTGALRRESVKKNVAAIHVSGKLTLLQRKLSNVLLLNAYDHLITRPKHSIDARTLCLMIGYNSNDMETLKASLRSLAETVAEWDMLDQKGRQEWGVSSLLSYAKLSGGVCEYAYSPALAEKLHDPKVFALINLNIQRRFTSGHALALYENCFRFVRTGSTGWWPIDIFRRLMGVDDSAYYENFKQLNAKIIKPAVAEVNKSSNIIVTPEFRKMARAVTDIRFLIKENPQLAMFSIDDGEAVRSSRTYQRLIEVGVGDRLARQWIAEHGEAHVAEKLDYVAGQGRVASPVRYLSAALRDDYAVPSAPEPSPQAVEALARRKAAEDEQARADALREAAIAAERRERAERMAKVRAVAESRNPTQRDADRRLFLRRLEGELEREDFARHGWGSALNARAIFAFWEELEPGIFDDLAA
ncbi:replication initiation protein [Cereibacter azotoformans]|uniref:Replication initiator protein n=2 Tax=Cereibacter TaxID=1653176 RepID=A0A2T5K609_9RHOB|nr:replication initiation protein [Cereibacter azotoformans]AXQ95656.1 replication initiation protein [Cereibacter sphaeroides]PTR17850.1 replication initiator protein [Cereibacter azotoformans]UIJ32852.1 replication initiation protein [Cereibacter azotoformans]ULB11261.1 replication initiation protein [Cereibacter azotoformans]